MGYGKFEYTREGVNHARGIYPQSVAGCAITSLNSPSDSEIVQPPPRRSLTGCCKDSKGEVNYERWCLGADLLSVAPFKFVGVVPCSAFEHSEADASNVAGNGVACVVLGHAFSQKMIVIVPERIVSSEYSKSSGLIDRFEDAAVPGFASAVAMTATEFLMFYQPTVTEVFSAMGKPSCIDHRGDDADGSSDANARDFLLASYQDVPAGDLGKTSFVLELAAAVQVDVLVENAAHKVRRCTAIAVSEGERLLLVKNPNAGPNNVVVTTGQQSQLIQSAVAMKDLVQESSPEQGTEFCGIDLVGLRAMQEQAVLKRVTDQDSVDDLQQFQIQPVRTSRLLEGDDDTSWQGLQVEFELFDICRTFEDPRMFITLAHASNGHDLQRPIKGNIMIILRSRGSLASRTRLWYFRSRHTGLLSLVRCQSRYPQKYGYLHRHESGTLF